MGRSYTPEERQEALRLYVEHGPAEAERRCGIAKGTIAQWAYRERQKAEQRTRDGDSDPDPHGVMDRPAQASAAIEASRLSYAQRRAAIGRKAGAVAEAMLDKIIEGLKPRDAADAMRAAAMAIDKAQLLAGGATSRLALSSDPEEARRQLTERTELIRDELAERRERQAA